MPLPSLREADAAAGPPPASLGGGRAPSPGGNSPGSPRQEAPAAAVLGKAPAFKENVVSTPARLAQGAVAAVRVGEAAAARAAAEAEEEERKRLARAAAKAARIEAARAAAEASALARADRDAARVELGLGQSDDPATVRFLLPPPLRRLALDAPGRPLTPHPPCNTHTLTRTPLNARVSPGGCRAQGKGTSQG